MVLGILYILGLIYGRCQRSWRHPEVPLSLHSRDRSFSCSNSLWRLSPKSKISEKNILITHILFFIFFYFANFYLKCSETWRAPRMDRKQDDGAKTYVRCECNSIYRTTYSVPGCQGDMGSEPQYQQIFTTLVKKRAGSLEPRGVLGSL